MADHSNNKEIKRGEKAHNQANIIINIFNQRSALKEKVTAFIKQQKEDYKDKHLYNFILQELFKEDFKGFTEKVFKKVKKSKASGLYLLLRIYKIWV